MEIEEERKVTTFKYFVEQIFFNSIFSYHNCFIYILNIISSIISLVQFRILQTKYYNHPFNCPYDLCHSLQMADTIKLINKQKTSFELIFKRQKIDRETLKYVC